MDFDTGSYNDHQIISMYGPIIGALIQAKTALYIHDDIQARRP